MIFFLLLIDIMPLMINDVYLAQKKIYIYMYMIHKIFRKSKRLHYPIMMTLLCWAPPQIEQE